MTSTALRLKLKYTRGHRPGSYEWAPRHNKHSDNNGPKKRHKLSGKQLAAAREITLVNRRMLHVLATGKSRFEWV